MSQGGINSLCIVGIARRAASRREISGIVGCGCESGASLGREEPARSTGCDQRSPYDRRVVGIWIDIDQVAAKRRWRVNRVEA